jgi:hypothetical protein
MLEDINDDVETASSTGKIGDDKCYDVLSSSFAGCDHLMDKVAKLSTPGNFKKPLVLTRIKINNLWFT